MKPFAIKPSHLPYGTQQLPIFPSAVPKKGIISYFLYRLRQCLLYFSLLSKSLLVSASKWVHSRFITNLRMNSFYNKVHTSKPSFTKQICFSEKVSHILKTMRNYSYVEFMFSLTTLEGKFTSTHITSYSRNTFVNFWEKRATFKHTNAT